MIWTLLARYPSTNNRKPLLQPRDTCGFRSGSASKTSNENNHQELYDPPSGIQQAPSPQVRDPLCWALLTGSTDGYKFFTSYSAAVDDMFLQVVGAPMPTQRWNWLKKLLRRNMTVHAIARYLYSRFRNLKAFILQPFPSMVAQVIPKDTLLYTLLRAVYR